MKNLGKLTLEIFLTFICIMLLLGAGAAWGESIGMGQPQQELAVGEYTLFSIVPNPLDMTGETVLVLIKGEREKISPLYLSLHKGEFENLAEIEKIDPTNPSKIEARKVTDVRGTRMVYKIASP